MQLLGGTMEAARQRNSDLNVGCYSWDVNKLRFCARITIAWKGVSANNCRRWQNMEELL